MIDLASSVVVLGQVKDRVSQFNNHLNRRRRHSGTPFGKKRGDRSAPPSAVKTRKRTPAKFFQSPIRIKLAEENFCSVAKIQLTDAMEKRYKIHTFWDWVTVGIYLGLGLAGLKGDVESLAVILQEHSLVQFEPTAVLSLCLVSLVWVASFSASLVKLYGDRLLPASSTRQRRQQQQTLQPTAAQQQPSLLGHVVRMLSFPFRVAVCLWCGMAAVAWIGVGFVLYVTKAWMIGPVLELWLDAGGPCAGLHWDTKQLAATTADNIVIATDDNQHGGRSRPGVGVGGGGRISGSVASGRRPRMKSSSSNIVDTFFNVTPRVDLLFDVRNLPQ